MYQLNDEQIEFIHNDIRARGVVTESLQLNVLDHMCCIIEQELGANGDFGQFYPTVVRRFCKENLAELEEETHQLLNNSKFYAMKRTMLLSGTFSAIALTTGIILKYLHLAGASILITLGIGITSLIFIPLVFTLKLKEKQKLKDRFLLGIGLLTGMLMAMAILFKIQHWPGANMMGVTAPILLGCVYLPIYFFTGIRNPETKLNTAVTSILILVGCGLFFSLTMTSRTTHMISVRNTNRYLRMEQLLQNEAELNSWQPNKKGMANDIYTYCEELKSAMLEFSAGAAKIDGDFETKGLTIQDAGMYDFVNGQQGNAEKIAVLSSAVQAYNNALQQNKDNHLKAIPRSSTILNNRNEKTLEKVNTVLEDIVQIQLQLLQNERIANGTTQPKEVMAAVQ
jgi:hypothetical protein